MEDNEILFMRIVEILDIIGKSTDFPLEMETSLKTIENNGISIEKALAIIDEYAPKAIKDDCITMAKLPLIMAYNKLNRKRKEELRSGIDKGLSDKESIKKELLKALSNNEYHSPYGLRIQLKGIDPENKHLDILEELVKKGRVFVKNNRYRLHGPLDRSGIRRMLDNHHDSVISVNRVYILHKKQLEDNDIRDKSEFKQVIPLLDEVDFLEEDDRYLSFNRMGLEDLIGYCLNIQGFTEKKCFEYMLNKYDIDEEILREYIWIDDEDDDGDQWEIEEEHEESSQEHQDREENDVVFNSEDIIKLRSVLKDTFYDLEEFTAILRENLESFNTDMVINKNCNRLGYRRNESKIPNNQCVFRNTYDNPTQAFRDSLKEEDGYVLIPSTRRNNITVYNELKNMVKKGMFYQVDEDIYITVDGLEDNLEHGLMEVYDFNKAVSKRYPEKTFCVRQIREMVPEGLKGISNRDVFYESLLIASGMFRTRIIQNVTLFNCNQTPTIANLIIEIIEDNNGCIDLIDLGPELMDRYGIEESESDLMNFIKEASIDYIEDKVRGTYIYLDYDVFLEMAGYDSTA